MKLNAQNINGQLLFYKNIEQDFLSFDVRCEVELNHGHFHAQNSDIVLLNIENWIKDVKLNLQQREGQAILNGTYNSKFSFSIQEEEVYVEFLLGDAFCGKFPMGEFYLKGRFDLELREVQTFISEFEEILEQEVLRENAL